LRSREKNEQDIKNEIQAIIRQITASVTFLPVLEEKCVCVFFLISIDKFKMLYWINSFNSKFTGTINILAFTDKDVEVPAEWIDSDPLIIQDPEYVRLRSFSTKNHKVDAIVSYRLGFY
jgi:mitotic spindle assembly checkpoint protein MAD2